MELLAWGDNTLDRSWTISENANCSYIRIYHLTAGRLCYHDTCQTGIMDSESIYILPSHAPFPVTQPAQDCFHCTWFHLNIYPVMVKTLISIPYTRRLSLLFDLIRCLLSGSEQTAPQLFLCADLFMQLLFQDGYLQNPGQAFSPVLDYLCAHFTEEITIMETAQHFGYTPEHFIRKFKKETGITPYQFLIGCRMGRSCELLRKGFTVTEVSELTGYQDLKTFERAFKNYHGRTASDYRKNFCSVLP